MSDTIVFAPYSEEVADVALKLRALRVFAAEGAVGETSFVRLPKLRTRAVEAESPKSFRLPKLRVLALEGTDEIGFARLRPLTGHAADSGLSPSYEIGFAALPLLRTLVVDHIEILEDPVVSLKLVRTFAGEGLNESSFSRLRSPRALGIEITLRNWFAALQLPGVLAIAANGEEDFPLLSYVFVSDALTINGGFAFSERLRVGDVVDGLMHRFATITELLEHVDTLDLPTYLLMQSATAITDNFVLGINTLLLLADALQAEDTLLTRRAAIANVAAMVYYTDLLQSGSTVALSDTLLSQVVLDASVQAFVSLLETMDVVDAFTPTLHAVMTTSDSTLLTDVLTAARAAQMGLIEQMLLGGSFSFAGIPYTIYAMTTIGEAVSEYQGWDFNSFAVIDGVAYGAGDGGIKQLGGGTDNGAPIASSVRMGLSNFGTALKKAVPNIYVGYNSTGALLMKVITTDRGVKKENWYQLNPISRGSDTGARFDVSKGLHSQYWDFEVCNIAGAAFELDFVQVWQMTLTRRK